MSRLIVGLALVLLAQTHVFAQAQSFSGAGSSAAAPIYKSWAREYQKSSGIALAYEPIGSSAGVKKIAARESDFGASDVAPPEAELAKLGLTAFPIAITGITPVVNLRKVGDGQVRLTGEVLARIFLGQIIQWNAPEIVELNPTISLPNLAIKVVVRSDGSGTTYNFADYLAKVSPQWKAQNGVKSSFSWPEAFIGAKGSDGVVKAVKETPGGIAYVDFGYVKEHKLSVVQLKNTKGEFVSPSVGSFRAALRASDWSIKGQFVGTLTAIDGTNCWPITMGTFALVPTVADKPEAALKALQFFVWAFLNGDALVQDNNFVRLPDRVQALAFKAISGIKDKNGQSIGAGLISKLN
ncbi:MAG: phosphate ABC transporter substrate-binding protein PstS [Pseudomonadota bacterium]